MITVCRGASRVVLLVGSVALKCPNPQTWRAFLGGLLANHQEAAFARLGHAQLCPVLLALPGGWLVVQPRTVPLAQAEYLEFKRRAFRHWPAPVRFVELKRENFGLLHGRVVCHDYGN